MPHHRWTWIGLLTTAALAACSGEVRVTDIGVGDSPGTTTSSSITGAPTTTSATATSSSTTSPASTSTAGSGGAACVGSWQHVFGGPGIQDGRGVAVAADDTVVTITQVTAGAITLDGAPFESAPNGGFLVTKIDASGAVVWRRVLGGAHLAQQILPMAIDGAGNTIVAGAFDQLFDAGNGMTASADVKALFVIKLSPSGDPLWLRTFPGTYPGFAISSLGADEIGNVVFAADISGQTLDIGGTTITGETVLAKLSPSGDVVWVETYALFEPGNGAVRVQGGGSMGLAGTLYGTVDFGSGPVDTAGGQSAFVAKLDEGGHAIWAKAFGDDSIHRSRLLAIAPDGAAVIAGEANGTADFGGGPIASPAWSDFVARFDAEGHHVWSKGFPSAAQGIAALAALPNGGTLVGGSADIAVGLGCGATSGQGLFLATLDAQGACASGRFMPSSDTARFGEVASSATGRVAAIGTFLGDLDFGVGPVSAGSLDAFVFSTRPDCGP